MLTGKQKRGSWDFPSSLLSLRSKFRDRLYQKILSLGRDLSCYNYAYICHIFK